MYVRIFVISSDRAAIAAAFSFSDSLLLWFAGLSREWFALWPDLSQQIQTLAFLFWSAIEANRVRFLELLFIWCLRLLILICLNTLGFKNKVSQEFFPVKNAILNSKCNYTRSEEDEVPKLASSIGDFNEFGILASSPIAANWEKEWLNSSINLDISLFSFFLFENKEVKIAMHLATRLLA